MYNYYIKIKEKEKLNLLISYPSYLLDRKVVKLNGSNYSTSSTAPGPQRITTIKVKEAKGD